MAPEKEVEIGAQEAQSHFANLNMNCARSMQKVQDLQREIKKLESIRAKRNREVPDNSDEEEVDVDCPESEALLTELNELAQTEHRHRNFSENWLNLAFVLNATSSCACRILREVLPSLQARRFGDERCHRGST
jgi:hypothetical protein